jgi:hypothetical protein
MRYTADELADMPTLSQGQSADLKVDEGGERVWLARTGIADGEPYDNTVTVERLVNGRWTLIREYAG